MTRPARDQVSRAMPKPGARQTSDPKHVGKSATRTTKARGEKECMSIKPVFVNIVDIAPTYSVGVLGREGRSHVPASHVLHEAQEKNSTSAVQGRIRPQETSTTSRGHMRGRGAYLMHRSHTATTSCCLVMSLTQCGGIRGREGRSKVPVSHALHEVR